MAKSRSICWARRNAALASSYSKLWSETRPARNSEAAVGAAASCALSAVASTTRPIMAAHYNVGGIQKFVDDRSISPALAKASWNRVNSGNLRKVRHVLALYV